MAKILLALLLVATTLTVASPASAHESVKHCKAQYGLASSFVDFELTGHRHVKCRANIGVRCTLSFWGRDYGYRETSLLKTRKSGYKSKTIACATGWRVDRVYLTVTKR